MRVAQCSGILIPEHCFEERRHPLFRKPAATPLIDR